MKKLTNPDDKAALVNVLRRIAEELGTNAVSRSEFHRRSAIARRKVEFLFGSYNGLVEAAGLVPRKFASRDAPIYSTEEVLAEMVRVLRIPDAKLTALFFERHSHMSVSPSRRFGGWRNALEAASDKLD